MLCKVVSDNLRKFGLLYVIGNADTNAKAQFGEGFSIY
jgi:hypothetical protein